MCELKDGFRFCSCAKKEVVHHRKSKRWKKDVQPVHFTWRLHRYDPEVVVTMDGMLMDPYRKRSDLDLMKFIEKELNQRNCFDFAYNPMDKDCIHLKKSDRPGWWLSYIYEKGEWKIGDFNPFDEHYEDLSSGGICS